MTATAANVDTMLGIIRRARSYGVRVLTVDGWRQRGRPYSFRPIGALEHHDASPIASGEEGALGVIVAGRPDLPGPLAQFQFPRCLDDVPTVIVVAAGLANHAGAGGPWHGIGADVGNTFLYGLEVANNGLGEDYTPALTYALIAVEVATLETLGAPLLRLGGHKEWAPDRKIDPLVNMTSRRAEVDSARLTVRTTGTLTYAGAAMPITEADAAKIARAVMDAGVDTGDTKVTVRRALAQLVRASRADAGRDARILTTLEALPALVEAQLPTTVGGLTRGDVRRATNAALRDVLDDVRLTLTTAPATEEPPP